MKVSGHTAAFAILKIFEENRVPKGGRLLHSDLSADWKTTGLCLSDLGFYPVITDTSKKAEYGH